MMTTVAQAPVNFLHYTVKDGLSQNSVHFIYTDSDGIVWIGTQDGLNTFDGGSFTSYRHSDYDVSSISDQFVLNIQEDSAGFLWVGTRNGLNRLDKKTGKFTRYYVNDKEKHIFQAQYENFLVQEDGSVVIAKEQIYILDPSKENIEKVKVSTSAYYSCILGLKYRAFIIPADNHLYFLADVRSGKQLTDLGTSPFPPLEKRNKYQGICFNDSMLIVYALHEGADVFVYNFRNAIVVNHLKVPGTINNIAINKNGVLAIAHSTGVSTATLKDSTVTTYKYDPRSGSSLPAGAILFARQDLGGNLWAGTAGSGFAVSNPRFNNFQLLKSPVLNSVVTCVAVEKNSLYVGTKVGLYKLNDFEKTGGEIVYNPLISNKSITALTIDSTGNIWAGVLGSGVVLLDRNGKILQTFSQEKDMSGGTVHQLSTVAEGRVVASTSNGAFVLQKGEKPVRQLSTVGLYIMNSYAGKDGKMWISSNSGLDVYDKDFGKQLTLKSGDDTSSFIKRTIVTGVAQDNAGAVWIGTIRAGVYAYSNGEATHYNMKTGLGSEVVYNLLTDSEGRLWVCTSTGLHIFDKETGSFVALSAADGIPAGAFSFGAFFKKDNQLFYGTSEGVLIVDAAAVLLEAKILTARVKDVKVNGRSVSITNNRFSVVADDKNLVFDLSSYPAFFSSNIIFQYRLSAQGEEWITIPQGSHSIAFNGLPYGNLKMEIRAATAENKLNTAPVSILYINSNKPFLKSTIFIALMIAAGIATLAWIFFAYNRRKFKKQLQELHVAQQLQGERTRIGRDLHDNIGAYTSALLSGINHIHPINTEQEIQVSGLKEHGSNIMSFLRETIWMLNTETLTITAFADRVKNYALRISKNYPREELEIVENIENERKLPPTKMLNIFRIVQEALQNAHKHAQAKNIVITIKSTDYLYFEIKDDGIGFDAVEKEDHYGLENMQARAAESGFSFELHSGENGTVVCIKEELIP